MIDLDRQVFRPYPGVRIVYGLLTVEARRQADLYASGPPAPRQVKGKKRINPARDMDPPPEQSERDGEKYARALVALVITEASGFRIGGREVSWDSTAPIQEREEALVSWPEAWVMRIARVATGQADLEPEEERGE